MKTYIMVAYTKGLGESCKSIHSKHGIQKDFKGGKTIRDLLLTPRDKDTTIQKCMVIC